MTEEANMELFDRWTETLDKEEFLKLGKELFPDATEEEMSDLFDESRAGYFMEEFFSPEEINRELEAFFAEAPVDIGEWAENETKKYWEKESTREEVLGIARGITKKAVEYGAKEENGKVTFADKELEQEFLKIGTALLKPWEWKFSKDKAQ